MALLDVPTYIRRLRAGGVPEDLAMTHAEAVTGMIGDGLATRADLHTFSHDLLAEINHVRDALRSEIKALEERMKLELNNQILALENRLLLKFGGMLATGIGLLAVFQALLK